MDNQQISALIASDNVDGAIESLNQYIGSNKNSDEAYYALGRLYWKKGMKAEAVNCYRRALEINPNSPARHALEVANDIFNFFNPDLLNP